MAVYLSPGVFVNEIDLSILPTATGELRPAFIGTANKGPLNKPMFIATAQDALNIFGSPFQESDFMYALLAYLEEGNQCYGVRSGIECQEGQDAALDAICIDTSGANVAGWGRIPLFTNIDFGRITLRALDSTQPYDFHPASNGSVTYSDAEISSTHGPTTASGSVTGTLSDSDKVDNDEAYTLIITGAPTLSAGDKLDGATFTITRNNDGTVLVTGTLHETSGGSGVSHPVSLGNGLSITITVSGGELDVNDTFTWVSRKDNRSFQLSVEGVSGSIYTMPTATYTTAASFITAFNALLSGENYLAVTDTLSDGTVVPQLRTHVAGKWIQLISSQTWANTVGQQLWALDIPRSHLIGTFAEPYTITTQNNQIVMDVIGGTSTKRFNFTLASGLGFSAASVAAMIQPNGIYNGDRYFDAVAVTMTDGKNHIILITDFTNHMFDQLHMIATFTNLRTLRFANETGILAPYSHSYRGFTDGRLALPAGSLADPATPASCESAPLSEECNQDSAYYANIVGFLVATSAGTWVHGYTVSLEKFTSGVGDPAGRYVIVIKDNRGVTVDQIQDVSFDPTATRYIGNVINPGSAIGGTNGNSIINWEARPSYLNNDPVNEPDIFEVRQPATNAGLMFNGMANGIPTDPAFSPNLDAAIIGNPALNTGIYSVQNPETYDISMLVTPGFSSGPVIAACLQMVESRGDVIYLVDPPFGLRAQQVVDWHNGMLTSDLQAAINSSYGALYWPWIKIFDQFNVVEIFVPPSGHVSAVYSRTSRVAELWSAPAGLNRGHIITGLDLEVSPSQGERDLLYGSGNAVNPLVNFPGTGIVVFGQRTLQRAQSALDRVNVRMLLIFLKKNMIPLLRHFLFEPNDPILWAQVKAALEPFLGDVQNRRGLTGFSVVVDATNNTPERIDRNELWVTVFLKPTRTVEFIVLNLVLLQTGASFSAAETLAVGGLVGA